MDVLIKNMKMPKERIMLEIFPNGRVLEINPHNNARIPTEAEAIELPPHGRLVDIDRMIADGRKGLQDVFPVCIESMDDLADFLETYADLDKTDHTVVVGATT